jgi:hypothetical protein
MHPSIDQVADARVSGYLRKSSRALPTLAVALRLVVEMT